MDAHGAHQDGAPGRQFDGPPSTVLNAWALGQPQLAIVAYAAYPITFFVYPWISGLGVLQVVWVASMAAFIGGNALVRSPRTSVWASE